MIAPFILLAAVGASASSDGEAKTLTCDMERADRSRFRLKGRFDKDGLHSNLSDLIRAEGKFQPAPYELVITSDGTQSDRWRLGSRPSGQYFEAALTRYGSETAVLLVERHKFVGRHWGRALVGLGLCDVGGRTGGKQS